MILHFINLIPRDIDDIIAFATTMYRQILSMKMIVLCFAVYYINNTFMLSWRNNHYLTSSGISKYATKSIPQAHHRIVRDKCYWIIQKR